MAYGLMADGLVALRMTINAQCKHREILLQAVARVQPSYDAATFTKVFFLLYMCK